MSPQEDDPDEPSLYKEGSTPPSSAWVELQATWTMVTV